jgi:hypothetical protein
MNTRPCESGKRHYSKKSLAKKDAKLARKGGVRLYVYRCRCGSFHLTSQKAQSF